jgi:hypothetical protein
MIGGFLTPVIKAFFSDRSFEAANDAMQLMGGHGYIHDNGVEQLVRDCRIFQLYEGANGVQAFDLAVRKLPSAGGKLLSAFLALIATAVDEVGQIEQLTGDAESLQAAGRQLGVAAAWLTKDGRDPYDIGGASYDFLEMVGIVAVGLMWLRTAQVADAMVSQGDNSPFLRRKLVLARYWFERELPAVQALGARVEKGATSLMDLSAELF